MAAPLHFFKIFALQCLWIIALPSGWSSDIDNFVPPVESVEGYHHFLREIPAPRGLIVDRSGKPLAQTIARKRVVLNLKRLAFDLGPDPTKKALVDEVLKVAQSLSPLCSSIEMPTRNEIERHWEHRPYFPLAVSGFVDPIEVDDLRCELEGFLHCADFQDVYQRYYPEKKYFAHIVGFTGVTAPGQHGPLMYREPLWQLREGRHGLENSFEEDLRGSNGVLSLVYTDDGDLVCRKIVTPPRPGTTIVTALNLEMQKKALDLLGASKRNGAFVAIDSLTGDVLAAASYPSFDPNEFTAGISTSRFSEIENNSDAPLFNRALSGMYPPGSSFKPIVALGGLSSNSYSYHTQFSGPPSLDVDGMEFRNWNRSHEGNLSLRYALTRSCNTWFYQAAIETGSIPILQTAQKMGFGTMPAIPLAAVASGNLPGKSLSDRGLANLSIGQGEVLASPLQMAAAMTCFASRGEYAVPRLVIQKQDPVSCEPFDVQSSQKIHLGYKRDDIEVINEGMWGVVNHEKGTAPVAKNRRLTVLGKTGTSQWRDQGEALNLAWFAGFIEADNPKIAFAVLSEGRNGDSVSGGKVAAPIAARFIEQVYQKPELYAVAMPPNGPKMNPLIPSEGTRYIISKAPTYRGPIFKRKLFSSPNRSSGRRGFFRKLGRRR